MGHCRCASTSRGQFPYCATLQSRANAGVGRPFTLCLVRAMLSRIDSDPIQKTYGKAADTSAFQTFMGLKALWRGMQLPGESLGHHFPEKNSSRERRTTHKSLKRCCSSQELSRRGAFSGKLLMWCITSCRTPYRRFWHGCGLGPYYGGLLPRAYHRRGRVTSPRQSP